MIEKANELDKKNGVARPVREVASTLFFLAFAVSCFACATGPVGSYNVPDTLGKGNVKVGVGAGGGVMFNVNGGAEGQVFVDIGVGPKTEFRVRATGEYWSASQSVTSIKGGFAAGPGLQFKYANEAGKEANATLLVACDTMVGLGGEGVSVVPAIGAILGFGDADDWRFILTPVASIPIIWTTLQNIKGGSTQAFLDLRLSAGFDIPVNKKVSLRPELAVAAGTTMTEFLSLMLGAGIAVVF